MKLEHCKVIVSDHVLDIFIGNKKSSFNIEDLNKINTIKTTEGSHTGKILGAMLGTGAQVATGDIVGIWQVIGTGIGTLYDEVFGEKETIKYLEGGKPILSLTISLRTVESEIANALTKVQDNNKDVEIGSYPFFQAGKLGVSIVIRSEDQFKIDNCNSQILEFVNEKKIEVVDR